MHINLLCTPYRFILPHVARMDPEDGYRTPTTLYPYVSITLRCSIFCFMLYYIFRSWATAQVG